MPFPYFQSAAYPPVTFGDSAVPTDGTPSLPPSSLPSTGNAATKPTGLRRVLLVEDDELASHALVLLLQRLGYDIVAALSVSEALGLLGAGSYDFVILDLMLPDGEGTEVLATIRARRLGARVIVATASGDEMLLDRVRNYHPDQILRKPTDIRTILSAMR